MSETKNSKATEFWRAVKFTLFSISAGIVQLVTETLLLELLQWEGWVAYLVALVASVVWNFTFNRRFTFQSASNVPVAMLKVLAFYVVFTPLSVLLFWWLNGQLGWNEYVVTAINMILNFITEYIYQRYFVFAESIDTRQQKEESNV